jgi:hypothetical protein
MIEAAPASSFTGSGADGDPQLRPTAPLHAEEFEEMKIKAAEETPSGHLQETIQNFNFEEVEPASSLSQPAAASHMAQAAAADEALLDLGDLEAPGAAAEADDFILDLQDEAPTQPTTPPSDAVASPADDPDAATLVDFQEEMIEAAPQAEDFVEAREGVEEQRAEFAPVEEAAPQVSEPQVFDPDVTLQGMQEAASTSLVEPPQAEATADVTADAGDREEAVATAVAPPVALQISLEQLSPEVIDAIARRAVEQLSERVVQEIAWEVVPQLAELLIKQRLEEEKKQ